MRFMTFHPVFAVIWTSLGKSWVKFSLNHPIRASGGLRPSQTALVIGKHWNAKWQQEYKQILTSRSQEENLFGGTPTEILSQFSAWTWDLSFWLKYSYWWKKPGSPSVFLWAPSCWLNQLFGIFSHFCRGLLTESACQKAFLRTENLSQLVV